MTFLVYLTMISANPEFTSALADIIMDSRIEITLLDNVSTNVKTQTYNYKASGSWSASTRYTANPI